MSGISNQSIDSRFRDESGREAQNFAHRFERYPVVRSSFAESGGQNKSDVPVLCFFVGAHRGDERAGRDVGPGGEGADQSRERNDAGDVVGVAHARFVSQQRGSHHAPGDGFAVLEAAIFRDAFEGVGESVAEIEDFAEAGFAFVGADDAGLDHGIARDQKFERVFVALQELRDVFLDVLKHRGVRDDRVLDHFGEPAAKFAIGQSAEDGGIGEDQSRRIERTNEIFSFGEIDAGFSADGAVNLGDERGGDMNESDSAEIGGGREACDVAGYAAADGDDHGFAIGAALDEAAAERFDVAHVFVRFSVAHQVDCRIVCGEFARNILLDGAPDFRRGNDVDAREFAQGGEFAQGVFEDAGAADYGVFSGVRGD